MAAPGKLKLQFVRSRLYVTQSILTTFWPPAKPHISQIVLKSAYGASAILLLVLCDINVETREPVGFAHEDTIRVPLRDKSRGNLQAAVW